jgi:predicted TPR repeat methyltransferase
MTPPRMPTPRAADPFEEAKNHFLEGLHCLEAGRPQEAERSFLASLALQPGRVSTLINLAAARLELARPEEALSAADEVLAQEADNIDAWFHRGTALGLLDRNQEALASFDKVISIDDSLAEPWLRHAQVLQSLRRPGDALVSYDRALAIDATLAQAWSNRGGILQELHRPGEAAQSFRTAIEQGADPELNGYYLAAIGAAPAPAAAPPGYVRSLFDDYADEFDDHLVKVLHYRAHDVLAKHLDVLAPTRFDSALDLGCGTGLCGVELQSRAQRLTGVDISAQMLKKASARGIYQSLVEDDIVRFLMTTPEKFDLVVAADAFIYSGELEPVFGGVRRVMAAGGMFCFSAEAAKGDTLDFELLPSLRYAHSEAYLRRLAERHAFDVVALRRDAIREDQRAAVPGMYVYLRLR